VIAALRAIPWRRGIMSLRQPLRCRKFFPSCLMLLWLASPQLSIALTPQITELQRLDFGVLAVTTNTGISSVVLAPQGTAAYGPAFVFIAAAIPGRYRLTGYPPFTDITVTMAATDLALGGTGPGELLTVSNAVSRPLTLHTDQDGAVDFDLGATLATSGTGTLYADGTYLGRPALTLNFMLAGQAVVSHYDIDARVELRSALNLVEVDRLDFGRFVAFSSASDQASMTLSPTGAVAINNPAEARILRLGAEAPGRFRLSAGAPFAPITVRLPVGTIYLTHQSQSPTVARLLVSDFTTDPTAGNLKLDAQGAIEFRLGATLRTEQTTNRYQDGVYSGTFSLTVEY
jgi:hypothetical protein